jgi:hypothetical protein
MRCGSGAMNGTNFKVLQLGNASVAVLELRYCLAADG